MNMSRSRPKKSLLLAVISLPCGGAAAQLPQRQLKGQPEAEVTRTNPDFIVRTPQDPAKPPGKGFANEHFPVFDGPDGSLMTVWTQSHGRRKANHNEKGATVGTEQ